LKSSLLLAAALSFGVSTPALASSDQSLAATLQSLPKQLGPNARTLYQDVFAALDDRRWADAVSKLDAMPEGPLHNVARAELYLAKGSPKVEAVALVALITKAPELPQAEQLARLAGARGAAALPAIPSEQQFGWLGSAPRRGRVAGAEDSIRASMSARIMPLIKDNRPNEAEAIIDANDGALGDAGRTEWRQRVAWSYFLTGDDVAARTLAAKAATGTGDWAAQADWVQGLAAWRQKDFKAAFAAFSAAARRASDSEIVAAAHFWAARAATNAGVPEQSQPHLKAASRDAETFYGLLALQALGLKAAPTADQGLTRLREVEAIPNVRAALALAEIGQSALADAMIRHQARIGDARDHAALATLAGKLELPSTQLWLAHNGPAGARAAVSARYPMPTTWQPVGGWRVDRSLVFAHALEESRFQTNVTSHAGARGLMQVLPSTAAAMARRRGELTMGPLSSPATNLEYGQTFIEQLRDMSETGGLLPKVIAAYNAGATPVGAWNGRTRDNADPLLYVESIPYWETRAYVTIVLRNYWMYQRQAGDQAKSLVALAQGMWPRFPGLPGATAVRLDRVSGIASAD
jgi:soluble lytic murein transglycosylase